MASQQSKVISIDKEDTNNLFSQGRWVKSVLLKDIRGMGILPPDNYSYKNIARKLGISAKSRNINSQISGRRRKLLQAAEPIQDYVSVAKRGNCFVDGCDFTTVSFISLILHVLNSHESVNEFSCRHCSHVSCLSIMVEHLAMHGPTMFQCKYCPFHHFSRLNLREHIKMKHGGFKIVMVKLRDFEEEEKQVEYKIKVVEKADSQDETANGEDSDGGMEDETANGEDSDGGMEDETASLREESNGLEGEPENIDVVESENSSDSSERVASMTEDSVGELDNENSHSESMPLESESAMGGLKDMPKETEHLVLKSEIPSDESENEELKDMLNIGSRAVNYHSTELEQRKAELEKNWQCGLCDFICLNNNMIAHAKSAHEIKYQFKCSLCSISIPSRGYVDSHCSIFHPSTIVTLIAYYYLPESTLPFKRVKVTLPDGQVIFSPENPVFVHKIPELPLIHKSTENISDVSDDDL